MSSDTYLAGLRMLARRELSEAQVRQRLERREYDSDSIDEAITRLKSNGSINDARVADIIARNETAVRRRGKLRVRQRLQAAGIPTPLADKAVEQVFQDIDMDTLMAAALDKRLRGRTEIADDREFKRLYRFLLGQGFEPGAVLALLRTHRRR